MIGVGRSRGELLGGGGGNNSFSYSFFCVCKKNRQVFFAGSPVSFESGKKEAPNNAFLMVLNFCKADRTA